MSKSLPLGEGCLPNILYGHGNKKCLILRHTVIRWTLLLSRDQMPRMQSGNGCTKRRSIAERFEKNSISKSSDCGNVLS